MFSNTVLIRNVGLIRDDDIYCLGKVKDSRKFVKWGVSLVLIRHSQKRRIVKYRKATIRILSGAAHSQA